MSQSQSMEVEPGSPQSPASPQTPSRAQQPTSSSSGTIESQSSSQDSRPPKRRRMNNDLANDMNGQQEQDFSTLADMSTEPMSYLEPNNQDLTGLGIYNFDLFNLRERTFLGADREFIPIMMSRGVIQPSMAVQTEVFNQRDMIDVVEFTPVPDADNIGFIGVRDKLPTWPYPLKRAMTMPMPARSATSP